MAIRCEELRIGNLVLFHPMKKIKRICSVKEIKLDRVCVLDKGLDLVLSKTEIQPIPLTPEILIRCGFEKWSENNFFHEGFVDYWKLLYHEHNNEWEVYYAPDKSCSGQDISVINHLHQLQNLYYSLTNTELLVNL